MPISIDISLNKDVVPIIPYIQASKKFGLLCICFLNVLKHEKCNDYNQSTPSQSTTFTLFYHILNVAFRQS